LTAIIFGFPSLIILSVLWKKTADHPMLSIVLKLAIFFIAIWVLLSFGFLETI